MTDCAKFLSFLFHKGLQYITEAGYRSMLSSVLQPVNNISVGQYPHIVKLIKGIFNSKPSTTRLLPEWELPYSSRFVKEVTIRAINLSPFEISYMKISLSCSHHNVSQGERHPDIKVGIWEYIYMKQRDIFIRRGLLKSDRQNRVIVFFFVFSLSRQFARSSKGLEIILEKKRSFLAKFPLFLLVVEPHKLVTSQTISK